MEWILWICNLAQEQGEMPEDCRKAIVGLLYKDAEVTVKVTGE